MAKRLGRYRQGDVALVRIKGKPKGLKKAENNILALGEATGHRHEVFDGEVYCDSNGALYVKSVGETTLQHVTGTGTQAEHAPIEIEEGWYSVTQQREYQPEGWRKVSD